MLNTQARRQPEAPGTKRMSLHDRPYSRGQGYGGYGGRSSSGWGGGMGGGGSGNVWRSIAEFFNLSFSIGRYFDIRVRVHILFLLLVLFHMWPSARLAELGVGAGEQIIQNLRWIALLFVSVLLHEFGHCFGCRAVGGRADDILMWPLGGLATCDPPRRPWPEFVTVACGPLVNVVIAGASYAIMLMWLGWSTMPVSLNPFVMWTDAYWFAADSIVAKFLADLFVVNYALLLFNVLLIFYPFDGGRLVQIALWVRLGYRRSMMIATTFGMVGAVGVAVVGLGFGNLLLMLIGVFGFFTCMQQRQHLRFMVDAEPEFDPRYAAAYEAQQGRRGAYFGSEGGTTQYDRSPGRLQRWREKRALKKAADARRVAEAAESEMNRILDKVHASGIHSLTRHERETLQRATAQKRRT